MILKQILITLLSLSLVLPTTGFSASVENIQVTGMLASHREIISGVGSIELVTRHGKTLADATFKLMADPKNRDFLNTPEGHELRIRQEKLTNFLAVRDHFEKCVKDKNTKRKLDSRILDSSFQNMIKIDDSALPCLPPQSSINKTFLDFNNDVMKSMKNMVKPYFQNQLSKKVISNTARSILAFRQKFKPEFMKQGYLTQSELNEMLKDVCQKKVQGKGISTITDVCQKMDPNFKLKLSEELIHFSKTQKGEKFTPEKATVSLNSAIDRLNSSLDKVSVPKDVGFIYDTADMENTKTKKELHHFFCLG